MRFLSVLVVVVMFISIVKSQGTVSSGLGIQQTLSGLSYSLDVDYSIGRFSIGGSLKIMQPRHPYIDNNQVFRNKIIPLRADEYFGFGMNAKIYFLKKRDYFLQPFINYNFIFTRSSLWIYGMSPQGIITDSITGNTTQVYSLLDIRTQQPLILLENYLNAGIDVRIYKRLYLTQKIGVGIASIVDKPNILQGGSGSDWEFSWMFHFGVKYVFVLDNKKKQNNNLLNNQNNK